MADQPQERLLGFSEAVAVSFVAACGYFVAFAYEAGFANSFGIPLDLVEVRLTSVFLAIGGLLVTLAWFIDLLNGLLPATLRANHPLIHYLRGPLAVAVVAISFAVVLGSAQWRLTLAIYAYLTLIVAVYLIQPLLAFREVRGYFAKLEASETAEPQPGPGLFARLGAERGRSVLFALMLVLLGYALGVGQATNRETFWVLESDRRFVLLRVYGNASVLGQVDLSKNEIEGTYRVMRTGDAVATFQSKKLGRVKLLQTGERHEP